MRAGITSFAFGLILVLSVASPAEEAPGAGKIVLSPDLSVEEIAPGIWWHVSWTELEGFGRSPGNGLVVVGEGESALVDTPWTDELTDQLIAWVEESLGSRVTAVVATHSHGDNLGGLAAAHGRGAESWALDQTAELARARGNPVPQHGFSDRMRIEVGGRAMELRHLGAGHTKDNIVVWIEDEQVLFGGCLVRSAGAATLGYTREADLEAWPHTIAALRETYGEARLIVPGHGSPGGTELLDRTVELLAEQSARQHAGGGQ